MLTLINLCHQQTNNNIKFKKQEYESPITKLARDIGSELHPIPHERLTRADKMNKRGDCYCRSGKEVLGEELQRQARIVYLEYYPVTDIKASDRKYDDD